jgi:hypothetical protein
MGERQTLTHFKKLYDPVTENKSRDVGIIIIITIIIIMQGSTAKIREGTLVRACTKIR